MIGKSTADKSAAGLRRIRSRSRTITAQIFT